MVHPPAAESTENRKSKSPPFSSVPFPPHNTHRIYTNQASQGDEVTGSKQAGPEEARFEREQPVLIHTESQSGSRQAAQHQPIALYRPNPDHPVNPVKKNFVSVRVSPKQIVNSTS